MTVYYIHCNWKHFQCYDVVQLNFSHSGNVSFNMKTIKDHKKKFKIF